MSEQTLFSKYGGFSTVHEIVRNFYADVLSEDSLKHYFENISMEFLIKHQSDFLSQVLGVRTGPNTPKASNIKYYQSQF